jgi:hypothetical protein
VIGGAYVLVDEKFSQSLKFADLAETNSKDLAELQAIVIS